MNECFEKMPDRRKTNCYKWDLLEKNYGNAELMPFWVADMEFETFPPILNSLRDRIEKQVYSYSFIDDRFFESIRDWYNKRHHVIVNKKHILAISGVLVALDRIVNEFTKEGDKVIINTPVYDCFSNLITRTKRVITDAPLKKIGEQYKLDFERIENQMRDGAKLYFFCNPHNPVGRVWSREDIEHVAKLCCQYGIPMVSDEIHSDIVFKGFQHVPAFCVSDEAKESVILINSPSKTFNIAALESAYIITENEKYRVRLQKEFARFHAGANFLGVIATETAYETGNEYVDALALYLEDNARFVCEYLKEHLPQVKTYIPEATYLMWLDFTACEMPQEELMEFLKKQAGLALSSGVAYGKSYEGFVRINIGAPRYFLENGMQKLAEAFARIGK